MRERLLPTMTALAVVVFPIALLSQAGSLARSTWPSWIDGALSRSDEAMTGTSATQADAIGFAPLHLAALAGDVHSATELLRRGANVNVLATRKRTPLYFAAAAGWAEVVEVLLRAGADPTIRAANGYRPIDIAQSAGHQRIVEMLAGPRATHGDPARDSAPIHPLLRFRA